MKAGSDLESVRRTRTRQRLRTARGDIKKNGGKPESEETRRIIARTILHLRRLSGEPAKRTPYKKIAAQLNSEGILTQEEKAWSAQDVYNVVHNKRAELQDEI